VKKEGGKGKYCGRAALMGINRRVVEKGASQKQQFRTERQTEQGGGEWEAVGEPGV